MIKAENCVKYLGILIDSNLNFRFHLEEIENKLSNSRVILYKLKPILPQNALFKLYYSMVHSQLLYGLVVWGSTFPSYLKELNSIQNKAVKLIGGGNYLDRATPYYSKLNILKLPDLYKLETAKFVYRFICTIPFLYLFLTFLLRLVKSLIVQDLRATVTVFVFLAINTNRLQQSIKYQGVKIWNSIPFKIQNLPFCTFKIQNSFNENV